MHHIIRVFQRVGYKVRYDANEDWDVLWSNDHAFRNKSTSTALLEKLKPHQKVWSLTCNCIFFSHINN